MSDQMAEEIAAIAFLVIYVYVLPLLAIYFVGKYICRENGEWWKQYVERMHSWPAPPQAAPDVWYDEPPLPKDGTMLACWIEGHKSPGVVVWNGDEWRMYIAGNRYWDPLAGRRVCPIAKPPEPTS